MTTILIFPFDLLSHYLRCLVLADSYDKSVYRILFLQSAKYNSFIRRHGYESFTCAQFEPEYVMDCAKRFDFSWLGEHDIETVLLSQLEVIQQFKADLVIGDVAPTLKMAAELTNVPYLSLLNGYMTKYYALTRRVPRNHRAYRILNLIPVRLSDQITNIAEKVVFRKIHEPFKNLRKKFGLQPVKDYMGEMEGTSNIICDLPELFPQKPLPANYSFVGPLVYDFRPDAKWLNGIDPDKPVICVSMGSTGEWETLAFLNQSYFSRYTIITAGDKMKVLAAPHILAKDFVNLRELLQRSTLMICHGGNGTIYQAILCNVFMLCVSSHFEQEWNMSALEQRGYGKSANGFSEADWKVAIQRYIGQDKITPTHVTAI